MVNRLQPSIARAPAALPAAGDTPAVECIRRGRWLQVLGPWGFEINRVVIPVNNLPEGLEGLQITHLSDLHLRSYWTSAYDQLIERIRQSEPDLLVITGDFVENKRDHRSALPNVRRLVSGLRARLGCYAVVGNHDGDLLAPRLSGSRLTFITGQRSLVHAPGGDIELIGLPGPYREDFSPGFLSSMPRRASGMPRIVLSHFPDAIQRVEPLEADVFLAGHTHGGQLCLPGGWPIVTHDSLPKCMCRGVHRMGRTWMVANRGFGFASIPVRLFCPCEMIEIELRRA